MVVTEIILYVLLFLAASTSTTSLSAEESTEDIAQVIQGLKTAGFGFFILVSRLAFNIKHDAIFYTLRESEHIPYRT